MQCAYCIYCFNIINYAIIFTWSSPTPRTRRKLHGYVTNQNGLSDNEYLGFSLTVNNGRYDFWRGGRYLGAFREIRFKTQSPIKKYRELTHW